MIVLVLIVPRFEQLFSDFKLSLPPMSAWLLGISQLCVRYYLWAALLPAPALWAYGNASIPDRKLRRALRAAAFMLVLIFLVFTIVALFKPLIALVEGITAVKHP